MTKQNRDLTSAKPAEVQPMPDDQNPEIGMTCPGAVSATEAAMPQAYDLWSDSVQKNGRVVSKHLGQLATRVPKSAFIRATPGAQHPL